MFIRERSSNDSSQQDKTGAILQMMTNPAVMNMASSLFGKGQSDEKPVVNDEGYKFEQPSKASQEFFKPIDNIADAEVKHKLYWFYDNWYVKWVNITQPILLHMIYKKNDLETKVFKSFKFTDLLRYLTFWIYAALK